MKTIIVTLEDGSQVAVLPYGEDQARVMFRGKPWEMWSPPFDQTDEGDNHTRNTWHARD